MLKLTVDQVLDTIKDLTAEQKQELENKLPSVLEISTAATATQPIQDSSLKMQGITISESSDVKLIQKHTVETVKTNLEEAKDLLKKLEQDIDTLKKKNAEETLQSVEEELKKPKPDKSLVDEAIKTLKKGLTGIQELAEPVAKVSTLISNAWTMML